MLFVATVDPSYQSSIETSVFVHDLTNPPAEDRSCNIDLTIVGSKHRIVLTKRDVDAQTEYVLRVPVASSIGLTSLDQRDNEQAIRDLVLALNLDLKRVCVSVVRGELSGAEVRVTPSESPVEVQQTPQGLEITVREHAIVREVVHITDVTTEEIDETQAIEVFQLIKKLNRHGLPGNIEPQVLNLSKALTEYENAMTVFPRLMIFKHLFNSLELSTNWNGVDRKGSSLDREVAGASGIPMTNAEKWRRFYDRSKHVDRTAKDASEFVGGLATISDDLVPLRRATTSVILDRLHRL